MVGKVSLTDLNDLGGATKEAIASGLVLAIVLIISFVWSYY